MSNTVFKVTDQQGYQAPAGSVLISCRSPGDQVPCFAGAWKDILFLVFDEVSTFDESDAERIFSFARGHVAGGAPEVVVFAAGDTGAAVSIATALAEIHYTICLNQTGAQIKQDVYRVLYHVAYGRAGEALFGPSPDK